MAGARRDEEATSGGLGNASEASPKTLSPIWRIRRRVAICQSTDGGATLSWVAVEGAYYQVQVFTKVTADTPNNEYTNSAEYEISGHNTIVREGTVITTGGGGSGQGTNVGCFRIDKEVIGSALIPDDREFEVAYNVVTPAGDVTRATTMVSVVKPCISTEYSRGSTVTLSEVRPTDSESILWSAPSFSQDEFTLIGGSTTQITLTNEANLNVGHFAVKKNLVLNDGLDDPGLDYTLKYQYPAGEGFAAGEGSLQLSSDGSVVSSTDLPVGAVVSMEELPPAEMPGLTWAPVSIKPERVIIGEGEPVLVTVTNTLSRQAGGFSIAKTVSGDGKDKVPADMTFDVRYSYPAGKTFAAGEGTVSVKAGDTATVRGIPAGAVVTLEEQTPAAISGHAWGIPQFSADQIHIVDGEETAVVLTNTLDSEAVTPSLPNEQPSHEDRAPLAVTGAAVGWLAVAVLVAVAAGSAAFVVRRRILNTGK